MAHIVNLDQNAINSLLQAHNNFRSARGLPALKWNSQIANQAVGWVGNSMKYENMMAQPNPHGQTQGVGQNIAWNFQSIPFPSSDSQLPYSGLVKIWNDETVPMQPGTYNHVSQVLWGSTTDVGCSVGVGPNPKTPSNAAYNYNVILVCDYFPPGNVVGQQWNTVTTGKTPPNNPNPNPNPNTPKAVPVTGKLVTMDQNAINTLLQAHNVFRAGKKMPPLKWNPNIANQAAQWAAHSSMYQFFQATDGDKISPQHGMHNGLGQNIAWQYQNTAFYTSASSLPLSSLVGRWNSENIPTTPGTYNQATQVLWGSTTEVGCAVVVGPNPKPVSNSIYNNDLILVCDYYPPGNIVGKQWNTVSSQPYYG